jgi:hypothetical protein
MSSSSPAPLLQSHDHETYFRGTGWPAPRDHRHTPLILKRSAKREQQAVEDQARTGGFKMEWVAPLAVLLPGETVTPESEIRLSSPTSCSELSQKNARTHAQTDTQRVYRTGKHYRRTHTHTHTHTEDRTPCPCVHTGSIKWSASMYAASHHRRWKMLQILI